MMTSSHSSISMRLKVWSIKTPDVLISILSGKKSRAIIIKGYKYTQSHKIITLYMQIQLTVRMIFFKGVGELPASNN